MSPNLESSLNLQIPYLPPPRRLGTSDTLLEDLCKALSSMVDAPSYFRKAPRFASDERSLVKWDSPVTIKCDTHLAEETYALHFQGTLMQI